MEQRHCEGCERSLTELFVEYNDIITSLNKRFKTSDPLLEDEEEVLEQDDIVFPNHGGWYCHTDCLSDCY